MVPNAALVTFVFGAPNQGVLKKLNASKRACRAIVPGSANVLNSEKSTSVGRLVRTSSSRVGSVRSVNGACTCQATDSLLLAQFWRAPDSVSVQVLNHRAIVRSPRLGAPTRHAPAGVGGRGPG